MQKLADFYHQVKRKNTNNKAFITEIIALIHANISLFHETSPFISQYIHQKTSYFCIDYNIICNLDGFLTNVSIFNYFHNYLEVKVHTAMFDPVINSTFFRFFINYLLKLKTYCNMKSKLLTIVFVSLMAFSYTSCSQEEVAPANGPNTEEAWTDCQCDGGIQDREGPSGD
jgi:hypothetical protein